MASVTPATVAQSATPASPTAASDQRREAVLDAVRGLLIERGWSRTTVSDVAIAAGVSRQDVYDEFGTRKGLAEAYVLRDVSELLVGSERAIRDNVNDPVQAVRGSIEVFLRLASDEPVIQIIVAGVDEGGLLSVLTSLGRGVAVEYLSRVIADVWPSMRAGDITLLADSLVRLAISHAVIPTLTPEQAAMDISRLITPFLLAQLVG